MAVADSFTPADQLSLDTGDHDMGMSAVLLMPAQTGALPHLAITSDKTGTLYLLNRDAMGGFNTPNDSSVQTLTTGYRIHSSAAFFNNTLYLGLDNGPLQAWALDPATDRLVSKPGSNTIFTTPAYSGGGGTPSISANGSSNGIAWIIQATQYNFGPAVLHAYNAADLTQELYNSQQAANGRDAAAIAVKFTTPTIANGRVYVGGRSAVTVYGLLNNYAPATATPIIQPVTGTYTGPLTVTITDATPNASIYYTSDGSAPGANSTLYSGAIQVTGSQTIEAVAIAPGTSQSDKAVATYTIKQSTQAQVPLTTALNIVGIFPDGGIVKSAGLDRAGRSYSGNQLGSSITLSGIKFVFGSAGRLNMISTGHGTVLALPAGTFSKLQLLGAAVHKDQSGVVFTVTYTDGTATSFTRNMSPWTSSKNHSGELVAYSGTYCDMNTGGRVNQSVYLYRYSVALNSGKTVRSITLPANSEVAIAAITLAN